MEDLHHILSTKTDPILPPMNIHDPKVPQELVELA
jgi:hypothetical protein